MSFQKRLFITYSLLIILLVFVLGIIFYQYSVHTLENNAISKLNAISDKIGEEIDSLIYPMNFIIDYLISNSDLLSSVITLSNLNRNNFENLTYINEALNTIKSILSNYLVSKNFYRVNIFNLKGDFITSNIIVSTQPQPDVSGYPWLKEVDESYGENILIPFHEDPWGLEKKEKVFSVVRSIQGFSHGLGYIEVQKVWSDVEEIFNSIKGENINILAITNAGKIFYNSGIDLDEYNKFYIKFLHNDYMQKSIIAKNDIKNRFEYIVVKEIKNAKMKILIIQDKALLYKPIIITRNSIILFGIIIVGISLAYIYIFSIQFTSPIRKLKKQMDIIEISNLTGDIILENTNDEIKALNKAFQRLLARLDEAIKREIKYRLLQTKASFEALQAQINPHFIYNILNVIAHRGILNNDEEICEICNNLASMLRYSTSTTEHYATVEEELEHVNNYLLLMKKRYEDKLNYSFDINPIIKKQIIPKIILQPIVENSFNHGFSQKNGPMEVKINGYVNNGWWFIEIIDNGEGFSLETLTKIQTEMKNIKDKLLLHENNAEFSIGGMGLLNTYARLILFFNEQFIFDLGNLTNYGAYVKIGAKLKLGEEDIRNEDKGNVS